MQLLQHVGVGGPAGFGLFPVGQAQVLKQDLSQLLGGIDVELLPGGGVNPLLQLADGVGQVRTEPGQGPAVHQEAAAFHIRQHPAQRKLHIEVQLFHALFPEPGQQHTMQGLYRRAIAAQRRPGGGPVSQQGEGLRLQVDGLWQLLVEIRHKQPGQVVFPGGGVQQIGRQGGVEHEALRREAAVQQRPHQILHVVGHLGDIGGKQRRQQGLPVPLIVPGPQLRRPGGILPGVPLDGKGGQVRHRVYGDRLRLPPLGQQVPGLVLCPDGDHRSGNLGLLCRLLVGPQVISVNELAEIPAAGTGRTAPGGRAGGDSPPGQSPGGRR